MNWLTIFGIAVGLAMDAFAVAIAAGLSIPRLTRRHVFRLAWHFGLFQFMMPILGWLAGRSVADAISQWDHWVVFALLVGIGGKMIYEAIRGFPSEREPKDKPDPTKGLTLITLSVATSIDALAVGLSMAVLQVSVWLPAVVIGLVAGAMTTIGICFGSRIGTRFEHWAEGAGGVVLIGIGARVLATHLLS